jgi:hypothetical protein
MKPFAIFITAIFFSSSIWATVTIHRWSDVEKVAFTCAVMYEYMSASGEEGELKESMDVKFEYWRRNLRPTSMTFDVDELIIQDVSSLTKKLEAGLISTEEVLEFLENCDEVQKEIETLVTQLEKAVEQWPFE